MRRRDPYKGALDRIARIEDELRRMNVWQQEPPPPEAFDARQAFFSDTMTLYQWLQFVLLPRVRDIVEARGDFPHSSEVGRHAIRELGQDIHAVTLVKMLREFDAFIESLRELTDEDPAEYVERFLHAIRTRDEELARRRTTTSSLLFREYGSSRREVDAVKYTVEGVAEDEDGIDVRCRVQARFRDGGSAERFAILRFLERDDLWQADLTETYERTTDAIVARQQQLMAKAVAARRERNRDELQRALEESARLAEQAAEGLHGLGLEPEWLAEVVSRSGGSRRRETRRNAEEQRTGEKARSVAKPPHEPESPAPEFFRQRAAEYWQARAAGAGAPFETLEPWREQGIDTGLADRAIGSVTGFREIRGDIEPCEEGVAVDAVIEADRGAWVVRTVLRREQEQWRIDPQLTRERTMSAFLRQHHIHPPYTAEETPRGRAMQFWHRVSCNDQRRARQFLTPETRDMDVPKKGQGYVDEFFWYLDDRVEPGGVEVRVLMNVRDEQRELRTWMVEREGQWFVDLAATLERSGC